MTLKEKDLTLGGGHTMQYMDRVSKKCTLKTYVILLTNCTPIHLIKNKEMDTRNLYDKNKTNEISFKKN